MADEKVDYEQAYKMVCADNTNKIIGYLGNYEAIGKNPVKDLFSNKNVGYALTNNNTYDKKYYNKVYAKVKYNNEKGGWEPDGKEAGEIVGNITRVLFDYSNKDFKVNINALATIAASGSDSIHEDVPENQASIQFKNGLHKYYDSKKDNSKLGLDSGSIKAAKDLLDSDLNESNTDKNKKIFAKYSKLYEMVSGKKIEPDKDGNIEIEKFEELSLVYYSFTTNITVIMAAVMIAALARKKKNEDGNESLGNENTAENNNDKDDYEDFSKFMHDAKIGGSFKLYGVTPNELGMVGINGSVWKNSLNYGGTYDDNGSGGQTSVNSGGTYDDNGSGGQTSVNSGGTYDDNGSGGQTSVNSGGIYDDIGLGGRVSLNTAYGELLDNLI